MINLSHIVKIFSKFAGQICDINENEINKNFSLIVLFGALFFLAI